MNYQIAGRVLLLAGVAFLLHACSPSAPAALTDADKAAIKSVSDAFVESWNAGNPVSETVALMYAEDARLMPPNAEMIFNREGINEAMEAMAGLKVKFGTLSIDGYADLAFREGTYQLTGPNGEVVDNGKFIEIWREKEGSWKMTNDIFNSDMPLPPPEEEQDGPDED